MDQEKQKSKDESYEQFQDEKHGLFPIQVFHKIISPKFLSDRAHGMMRRFCKAGRETFTAHLRVFPEF